MEPLPQARLIITGIVQGVGFRPFLFNLARNAQITGRIFNSGNLGVICDFRAPEADFQFKIFVESIRNTAPIMAFIEKIQIDSIPPDQSIDFSQLIIGASEDEVGTSVVLPPDIAICDACLNDMQNPKLSRFYQYPFIACAQCGPRFTTMRTLPYDRQNSTMDVFPFCQGKDSCQNEYNNFNDRRFHAETFACHRCGPYYFTVHQDQELPETPQSESIEEVAQTILNGGIAAIKGIGGIFLVCSATDSDAIARLRDRKRDRKNKPFAVMFPSLEKAREYCEITPEIENLLGSYRRPIVLLPKSSTTLPDNLAPGLIHLGVILPYTGVHYLLFNALGNEPIVYTSGNLSSLPMAITNEEIFTQLHDIADIFYFHNREIFQRADDSVLRPVLGIPTLIRRSRGYVPQYFTLPFKSPFLAMMSVGPEMNSTGAIARGERIFPTQHIGNVRNLETYQFLHDALLHMQTLLKVNATEIGAIGHDLHPAFQSTHLAHDLAEELKMQGDQPIALVPIQHHHAHLASLMIDHAIALDENIVGIMIDGVGYGLDQQSWGGEILFGGYSDFERAGSLTPWPMLGGDLAVQYPARLMFGLLANLRSPNESLTLFNSWNQHIRLQEILPQGQIEFNFLLQQLNSDNLAKIHAYPQTSSLGRWLDAVAALFNVCQMKTYQGEPAIRLEGYAWTGEAESYFDLSSYQELSLIRSDRLFFDYADLFLKAGGFDCPEQYRRNLARSMIVDIAKCLASQAITIAQQHDDHQIGVSGGVAVNEIIMQTLKTEITTAGFEFIQHQDIPCGDAGISSGQLGIVAALKLAGKLE